MNSNQGVIRVISVDDHELLRRGIRFALMAVDDITLVGEAADGEEALQVCAAENPDVVLLDMHLPGTMTGPEVASAILDQHPTVSVIALSSFFDAELVQAAMQAGATGYLVKGASSEVVADAIRGAKDGRPTLSSEAVQALVKPAPAASTFRLGSDLTERELEVLAGLVAGKSNSDIAVCLIVSVAAVKYHVSSILSKLGAKNRTEAAMLAVEHNLIPKA